MIEKSAAPPDLKTAISMRLDWTLILSGKHRDRCRRRYRRRTLLPFLPRKRPDLSLLRAPPRGIGRSAGSRASHHATTPRKSRSPPSRASIRRNWTMRSPRSMISLSIGIGSGWNISLVSRPFITLPSAETSSTNPFRGYWEAR